MVYSQEFRNSAIAKYEEIGSYWKAAKMLNVSIATLHRWVRHKDAEGELVVVTVAVPEETASQ